MPAPNAAASAASSASISKKPSPIPPSPSPKAPSNPSKASAATNASATSSAAARNAASTSKPRGRISPTTSSEWIYYGDRRTDELTPDELEDLWQAGDWYGVKGFFDWLETKAYKMHVRVFLSRYRSYTTCSACRGKRLQPEALCFKIHGKTLPDLWALPIADLLPWFSSSSSNHHSQSTISNPPHPDPTLDLVLTEITSRLSYLDQVGLGYLTLDRPTRTLSGGEVERVNLTTCLGASLTGTLFVLDEPTVGLHARDIERLVGVMHGLRDKGNTLVVVEHEQAVMLAADHLVDLGPGAGQHGGHLIYQGPPKGPRRLQTRKIQNPQSSNLNPTRHPALAHRPDNPSPSPPPAASPPNKSWPSAAPPATTSANSTPISRSASSSASPAFPVPASPPSPTTSSI